MGKRESGFTMVELILVITLLGILAVVALPRFFNMQTGARQAARAGVVPSVRSGAALFRANDLVQGGAGAYPASLDNAGTVDGACATANPCFGQILDQSVTDGRWAKAGDAYTYDDGDAGTPNITYTYTQGTGTFQ